jgi:hypothetical protein
MENKKEIWLVDPAAKSSFDAAASTMTFRANGCEENQ